MRSLKLYMAPLRGFTDHIYRNTFARHFGGFDLAVAPFISSTTGNKIRRKYVKGLLPENNTGMPVVPQILSNDADGFILLANVLVDLGYDAINWNLGCPYPTVANKKRGSGLLPHTDRIQAFMDAVIPALRGKLSIKARLGRESNRDIFKLIPVLNRYPIGEIIIHPRTGLQQYTGDTDLDAFEKILGMSTHPVVYNGDITSTLFFRKLSIRFNTVNRWMIGRGALANPFLPKTIKTGRDDTRDKCTKIKRFHDDLFAQYSIILYGPSHILDRMKGFWRYFCLNFRDGNSVLKKIRKTYHPDQYLKIVNDFFKEAEWVEKEG